MVRVASWLDLRSRESLLSAVGVFALVGVVLLIASSLGLASDRLLKLGCVNLIAALALGLFCGSTGVLSLGEATFSLKPSHISEFFVALYVLLFAAVWFLFEISQIRPIAAVHDLLRRNFGFLFSPIGKCSFIVFIAFLNFGVADQAKKRERPRDASGQEVDSARMAELDLEDSEYGGDASPNEKLKKKGRARYSQCGGGCGDFFYWASGGLLGSQTKPPGPPPGPPAGDGLDATVAEDLKNAGAKVEAKPATSVSA